MLPLCCNKEFLKMLERTDLQAGTLVSANKMAVLQFEDYC